MSEVNVVGYAGGPERETSAETAVVIGATGAFGRVIVSKLLDRGLDVLAVARSESALGTLQDELPGLRTCCADVASKESIEYISRAVRGRVRAVVHGPGVGVAGGILDADIDILNEAVNIKVGGLLRVVRATEKYMTKNSRIIAIGGHYGLEPTAYAASAGVANAALVNVVRQLSLGYGARGITAHVVAPGPAETERLRNVAIARAQQGGVSVQQVLDEMLSESSISQFTTPEQVAWAVSLLLDEEAGAMTGATLMLDSGRRRGLP
ncbi:SDR family NAD(P)-dependent oxidoreductase [Marinobacter pelagius]|uniref:Short-chain dehydrogenase n=1 Tax=Marinobacter pelagius TaxID=379482 RepID=A0A1I4QZB3_9GAMM|nr:SDR family oxidoreductase [Marinobacter pelagius]SFM45331.1 Short-chain dehydrogenase [Marinobacter pelagius]